MDIINDLALAAASLKSFDTHENVKLGVDNEDCSQFLLCLHRIFSHGIWQKQSYWITMKPFSPGYILNEVERVTATMSNCHKGYAWLHVVLNEKLLGSILSSIEQNPDMLAHYFSFSCLRSNQIDCIKEVLSSIDGIIFNLKVDAVSLEAFRLFLLSSLKCYTENHRNYPELGSTVYVDPMALAKQGKRVVASLNKVFKSALSAKRQAQNIPMRKFESSQFIGSAVKDSHNLIEFDTEVDSPNVTRARSDSSKNNSVCSDPWDWVLSDASKDSMLRGGVNIDLSDSPIKVIHKPLQSQQKNVSNKNISFENVTIPQTFEADFERSVQSTNNSSNVSSENTSSCPTYWDECVENVSLESRSLKDLDGNSDTFCAVHPLNGSRHQHCKLFSESPRDIAGTSALDIPNDSKPSGPSVISFAWDDSRHPFVDNVSQQKTLNLSRESCTAETTCCEALKGATTFRSNCTAFKKCYSASERHHGNPNECYRGSVIIEQCAIETKVPSRKPAQLLQKSNTSLEAIEDSKNLSNNENSHCNILKSSIATTSVTPECFSVLPVLPAHRTLLSTDSFACDVINDECFPTISTAPTNVTSREAPVVCDAEASTPFSPLYYKRTAAAIILPICKCTTTTANQSLNESLLSTLKLPLRENLSCNVDVPYKCSSPIKKNSLAACNALTFANDIVSKSLPKSVPEQLKSSPSSPVPIYENEVDPTLILTPKKETYSPPLNITASDKQSDPSEPALLKTVDHVSAMKLHRKESLISPDAPDQSLNIKLSPTLNHTEYEDYFSTTESLTETTSTTTNLSLNVSVDETNGATSEARTSTPSPNGLPLCQENDKNEFEQTLNNNLILHLMLLVVKGEDEKIQKMINVDFEKFSLLLTHNSIYVVKKVDGSYACVTSFQRKSTSASPLFENQGVMFWREHCPVLCCYTLNRNLTTSLLDMFNDVDSGRAEERAKEKYETWLKKSITQHVGMDCVITDKFISKWKIMNAGTHSGTLKVKTGRLLSRWTDVYVTIDEGIIYQYNDKYDRLMVANIAALVEVQLCKQKSSWITFLIEKQSGKETKEPDISQTAHSKLSSIKPSVTFFLSDCSISRSGLDIKLVQQQLVLTEFRASSQQSAIEWMDVLEWSVSGAPNEAQSCTVVATCGHLFIVTCRVLASVSRCDITKVEKMSAESCYVTVLYDKVRQRVWIFDFDDAYLCNRFYDVFYKLVKH